MVRLCSRALECSETLNKITRSQVLRRLERISTKADVKKYFKKFNRYKHDNIEYVRLESVDEDLETSS